MTTGTPGLAYRASNSAHVKDDASRTSTGLGPPPPAAAWALSLPAASPRSRSVLCAWAAKSLPILEASARQEPGT
eukprot:CAMPEP_0172632352 /NCGR_PEP_ID=MMETSP1068-20121228/183928_1 /TAXON_ID=35684 /ORGANISM="Pseudopedinella elastica, Strain CCMP716" /LENGTH=74 /DNA_ID=CAMNT_0013443721 /DNA_START=107 /DNA_END=328 /DNA_ORIENTATION=-